jgi:hypothetical protein
VESVRRNMHVKGADRCSDVWFCGLRMTTAQRARGSLLGSTAALKCRRLNDAAPLSN